MKKAYREMFDEVHASEQLRAEVMNMKNTENMNPRRRVPAAALIAAVLVIALAGTALAAEYFGWVKIRTLRAGELNGADMLSGYLAEAEYNRIPVGTLSEAALQRVAAIPDSEEGDWRGEAWSFGSWSEAEEFLGLELANNPLLEQFEKKNHSFGYGTTYAESPCLAIVTSDNGMPEWIPVIAAYQDSGCEILQIAFPQFDYPERGENAGNMAAISTHAERPDEFQTEEYVTANGTPVQIAASTTDQEAYFVLNGTLFELCVKSSENSADHARELLKQVLDAYE